MQSVILVVSLALVIFTEQYAISEEKETLGITLFVSSDSTAANEQTVQLKMTSIAANIAIDFLIVFLIITPPLFFSPYNCINGLNVLFFNNFLEDNVFGNFNNFVFIKICIYTKHIAFSAPHKHTEIAFIKRLVEIIGLTVFFKFY